MLSARSRIELESLIVLTQYNLVAEIRVTGTGAPGQNHGIGCNTLFLQMIDRAGTTRSKVRSRRGRELNGGSADPAFGLHT